MSHAPRLNAWALVALLWTAGLAALASPSLADHEAAGGASRGSIHFTRLDQVPYPNGAQIYGTGASVMIVLQDGDLADPTFEVNVRSLSDEVGEDITLRRVLLPSGTAQYHGFVGFETALERQNGNVFVRHGDRVTVVYFDADRTGTGQAGVSAHNLTWIETQTGRLILDKDDYFGLGEEAEIIVEDADIPSAATGLCVHVTSDSDPVGFNMSLHTKIADGKYRGNLGFTAGPSSTGHPGFGVHQMCINTAPTSLPRIRVVDGDLVYVNYTIEGYDQRGRLEDAQVWAVWHQAYSGRIQWVTSDYRRVVSENPDMPFANEAVFGTDLGRNADTASAWLRVEDRDLTGRGTIRVNVRSLDPVTLGGAPGVDPTGIFVTLYETSNPSGPFGGNAFRSREYGQGTGEFTGFLSFHTDDSIIGSQGNRLRVTEGAIVVARYEDNENANGDLQVVESRVRWHQSMTGTLRFKAGVDGLHGNPEDAAHYTTDASTVRQDYNSTWVGNTHTLACPPFSGGSNQACHWDRGYLELRDTDLRGRGDLNVTLRSSRDPLGIQLLMIEATVNGIVDSGVFRGSFGFNHTHSSDGQLTAFRAEDQLIWARGCDDLEAVYFDARAETGRTQWVSTTYTNVVAIRTNGGAPNCTADPPFAHQNDVAETLRGQSGDERLTLHDTAAGGEPTSVFRGYREAWVHLVDYEQNQTNRLDMTNRTLIVASTSYPAQTGWPDVQGVVNIGNEVGPIHQLDVTMTETVDGVFVGRFRFVPIGEQDDGFPALPVRDGDVVCAYWLYTNATGVPIQLLQSNQETRLSKPQCSIWRETHDPVVEFRSAPHQGASMNNVIGVGPEAAVFYNGTGKQWTYNEALGRLDTNQAWVFVRDIDAMADTTTGANSIRVKVRSESHLQEINIDLFEVYGVQNFSWSPYEQNRTGILPWSTVYAGRCGVSFGDGGTCAVPGVGGTTRNFVSGQDDRGFLGVFNITRRLKLTPTGTFDANWYDQRAALYVQDGDTITVFYQDAYNRTGTSATYAAYVDWQERHTATLSLDRAFYRNHADVTNTQNRAIVTLRDKDLDTDVGQQSVTVRVYNNRTRANIPVVLEETGPRTGEFKGEFCFLRGTVSGLCAGAGLGAGNGLAVLDEDAFFVNYTDQHNVHGETVTIMDHGEWFDTTSTLLTLDAEVYAGHGSVGRIRVEDVDLDTTAGPDTVQVWVRSETDGAGELVTLTETGPRTRIFEGILAFQETHAANDGKVQVLHGDQVTVYLFDRRINSAGDTAVKTVQAVWETAPNRPPVLDLPSLPAYDEEIDAIPVHFGKQRNQFILEPIAFFPNATDLDGRIEGFELDFGDGSPRIVTVDHRGPSGQPLLHAYAVERFWEGFSEAASSTIKEKTFQVRFTAWDEDGARTTLTRNVRLIKPDTDRPSLIDDLTVVPSGTKSDAVLLEWTAPENNDAALDGKAPTGYLVRYNTTAAIVQDPEDWNNSCMATDLVFMRASDNLSVFAQPGLKQRVEVRGLEPETSYFFAVRAVDVDPVEWHLGRTQPGEQVAKPDCERGVTKERDVRLTEVDTVHATGYAEDLLLLDDPHTGAMGDFDGTGSAVRTLRADTEPPVGQLNIRSSTHQRNTPSEVRNVQLSWNSATTLTAGSAVTFRYLVSDQATGASITSSTGTSVATNRTTLTNLVVGTHYFHLAACSMPGCGRVETFGPIVIVPPGDDDDDDENVTTITDQQIVSFNRGIRTNATRSGADNTITWTLPSGPVLPVQGVQIWRADDADDAFSLLVDIDVDDPAFAAKRYVDAGAPAEARYVVTAYYGPSAALGRGSATGDPAAAGGVTGFSQLAPATVATQEAVTAKEPLLERLMSSWWFWLVVALGVLLIAGLIVGVVLMNRRGGDEGDEGFGGDDGMGWGGASEAGSGEEEWPEVGADGGFDADDEGGTAVERSPQESYAMEAPVAPVAPPPPPAQAEPVEDRLTHHLTCPSCGAGFTAHGEKPMVTECPSCGAKGVLR